MASVYTNDLRLEEIGSGEQSGTWGDTTNTNLELIAEAFSFGTEAITTNADTHATTIADGATDAGRSMFLKYTGTLDSACTITIGPNTVSKLWFIENGTSGSQNIIIKQGSGATITIPAGQTKAIYSNGAGSGGAMVDAFATLNVVDLLVDDDLTVTDDAAIGGLATVGGTLAVTGVVTANAGVVVDNITIDGNTVSLSSGDFLLDVAGDIIFDADGEDLKFKDGTVHIASLFNQSSDFVMQSSVTDKDLLFKGDDGGGIITALKLDMSDAGAARFVNGTGSLPAVSFISDPNTGMLSGGADNLSFSTGGTIRAFLSATQWNVTGNAIFGGSAHTFAGAATVGTNLTLTNGDLIVAQDHGINFAAQTPTSASGASTTAELLNHYEQGTFTAGFSDNSGRAAGGMSVTGGFYTRIGAMVHIHGYVVINGLGSMNGAVLVTGLPFAAVNVTNGFSAIAITQAQGLAITAGHNIGMTTSPNSPNMSVRIFDETVGTSDLTHTELSADGGFIFGGSYHAV